MTYPRVLTEDETLDRALSGVSLARYGDGELNLAIGADCIFQHYNPGLAIELRGILREEHPNLLPCIPNIGTSTNEAWARYRGLQYRELYTNGPYGSAFVSRPDSAPGIDRPEYWRRLESIWRGKDVVLVKGSEVSLREDQLSQAASVRVVTGPRENAYARIADLEREIGRPGGPVMLCLGPTATVLAARLARSGVHALDLGHVGLFMRHAGAYAIALHELVTLGYREQLRQLHANKVWGQHGASHAKMIKAFVYKLGAQTILDYGCGTATLGAAMAPMKVQIYDPAVAHRDGLPKPADLVVATDVLEHVEPELVDNVMRHIFLLAELGAYVSISCQPARERLPDGRNAHLSIHDPAWWLTKFVTTGWTVEHAEPIKGIRVWLKK